MPTDPRLQVIITGAAVGLDKLAGLVFDKDKPFRACLICGAVFQSKGDRKTNSASSQRHVEQMAHIRILWANKHAREHSIKEHDALKRSGNVMTPEAANKLAAFGLIPAVDAVLSDEINIALLESSAIPQDDCES